MNKKLWLGLVLSLPVSSAWALNLSQAYQRALSYDTAWQANQVRWQIEQQNLGIAKGAILPTIGVNASIDKQYQNQDESANNSINIGGEEFTFYNSNTTTKQLALNLRQALFRMDVWEKYKQVEISQQLAELKLQSQQQELMLNVANNYFEVLRQQRLLITYQQEEQALLQQYQMMQAKFREGLVARMDVSEADAQYQSTIAKRVAGEVQYQLALEQLEQLVGKIDTPLSALSADFQFQSPVPESIETWLEMAQRNNLQLNQTRVTHRIAIQQISIDQADYYPQLEAVASSVWTKQSPENILSSNARVDKVGLELNWTPYTGTRSAIIKKSRLEADAAKIDIDTTWRQVQTDLKRSYLQVATGYRQLNAYKVALQSAELVEQASQASYREGLKTMVDVLLAQRNAFVARQDYVNAQYDYILNALQLKALSGQLNEDDLQQLNIWLE